MPPETENPSQDLQDTQNSSANQNPSLLSHPHDYLMKFLMGFQQFYLPFFQRYLPADIQEKLNLNRLEPMPSNFAGPRNMRASDAVFRCPLKNNETWFYGIVESQATDDKDMDWRAQEYKTYVFQYHIDTVGQKNHRPPWIVSIVLYTGRKKSVQPPASVFKRLGPRLEKQVREALTDAPLFINWREPAEMPQNSGEPLLDATQQLMHHTYVRDPWPVLKQVYPLLVQIGEKEQGREFVHALLNYALRRDGSIQPNRVTILLGHIEKEFQGIPKEEAMSIADALKREGRVEGEKIGMRKGEELGMHKGQQLGLEKTATRMLRRGMQTDEVIEITHLSRECILELQAQLKGKAAPKKDH